MAGNQLGPVVTTFTARTKEFEAGFKAAEKRFEKVQKRAERTSKTFGKTGKSASKLGMGAQELARGFEDASSQLGTAGLSGALRGAGNNLSQFATLMGGPEAGAIAGVAVGVGSALVNAFSKGESSAKKFNKEMENLNKTLDRFQKGLEFEVGSHFSRAEFEAALDKAAAAKGSSAAESLVGSQRAGLRDKRRDLEIAQRSGKGLRQLLGQKTGLGTELAILELVKSKLDPSKIGSTENKIAFEKKIGSVENFKRRLASGELSKVGAIKDLRRAGLLDDETAKKVDLFTARIAKMDEAAKRAQKEIEDLKDRLKVASQLLKDKKQEDANTFAKKAGDAVQKEFQKMFAQDGKKLGIGKAVGKAQANLARLPEKILSKELQVNTLRRQLLPKFRGLDLRGGGATVGVGGSAAALQRSAMDLQNAQDFTKSPQFKLDEERNKLLRDKLTAAERELKGLRSDLKSLKPSSLSGGS